MERNDVALNYLKAKRLTAAISIIAAPCLAVIGVAGYLMGNPQENIWIVVVAATVTLFVMFYATYMILDRMFPLPLLYMSYRSRKISPKVAVDCIVGCDDDHIRLFAMDVLWRLAKSSSDGVAALAVAAENTRILSDPESRQFPFWETLALPLVAKYQP